MTDENQCLMARLAKAREEFNGLSDFQKVKSEGLRFAYLPVETAKPLIEKCTAQNGITILPMKMDIIEDRSEKVQKPNGNGYTTTWTYITANVTFRLACPGDSLTMEIMAEAQDNSDKAINKVYTMAYKNLIKIVFGFSESGKDDSKFDDPRQQDNDFNQSATQSATPRRTSTRTASADPFFSKGVKS